MARARELLRGWVAMVERVLIRDWEHYVHRGDEYQSVHQELLQLCRQQEKEVSALHREVFHQIHRAIAPWVSLEMLASADREIVTKLLKSLEPMQRALGQTVGPCFARRRRPLAVALTAGGLIVGAALLWAWASGSNDPVTVTLRSAYRAFWAMLRVLPQDIVSRPWLVAAGLAVVLMILWLSQSAKSS